jgi:chromosome segregation ATPase
MRRDVSVLGSEDPPPLAGEGVGRIEPAEPARTPYDDLGGRVAGVLQAAEQAATQIRADAEVEAATIRASADEYADDVRQAVDTYANQQRRESEAEAAKAVEAGLAEARAMREAAQSMARQLEQEARARADALRAETRGLEERRSRALDELRDIAATLEDLLGGDLQAAERPAAVSFRRRR